MPCAPPVTRAAFSEYSRAVRKPRYALWILSGRDRGNRAMQVKEILRVKGNRLISIEPSGRAADDVATMAKDNLGSHVVVEQGRMVGMLTFHELLQAVAERPGALGEVGVVDIMQGGPATAPPERE